MKALRFRVRNYRNIDDSDWVVLEQVTAFVGRNESGKTALLKALHKFNPATPEPYDPQREFPRDRYTRDFVRNGSKGKNWPVCTVEFAIPEELQGKIANLMPASMETPAKVTVTRYYDGSRIYKYAPVIEHTPLAPDSVISALNVFAASARRLAGLDAGQEGPTQPLRAELVKWATDWKDMLQEIDDLRGENGSSRLTQLSHEAESKNEPLTADMVEALVSEIKPVLDAAGKRRPIDLVNALIEENLPVLIYFEDYGILDSAIWLQRFLEDFKRDPTDPRIRTINAMFKLVGLDATEVTELGHEQSITQDYQPTEEQIAKDQRNKEERAILLNSASNDISARFSSWYRQRRHKIRYHADGDYFRIWIADDLRPDVEIELEARSKGFQWFFSFYLVFLAESEAGHKDAMLLLDEPGLHLHPTAQQELIELFETLSTTNQLAYSTHSPFLIDGEHLHRVRPVTEDDTGHSRITTETWPKDRETIFPLQAAAGYAMIRGLFQHHKNVLVEGMSDFYYLHALSQQCATTQRITLPEDIHITPCGGTKNMGTVAALFMGQEARPLVLLDGDYAGRARRDSLVKSLYSEHGSGIVMLDVLLERPGQEVEIEDILGEVIVLGGVETLLHKALLLGETDRSTGSLPSHIEAAAKRQGLTLPTFWKASVARHLVSSWAENGATLPDGILDTAALLFSTINEWFENAGAGTIRK